MTNIQEKIIKPKLGLLDLAKRINRGPGARFRAV